MSSEVPRTGKTYYATSLHILKWQRACWQDTGLRCDHMTFSPHSLMTGRIARELLLPLTKGVPIQWPQKAMNSCRVPGLFEDHFTWPKIRRCKLCTETKHQIITLASTGNRSKLKILWFQSQLWTFSSFTLLRRSSFAPFVATHTRNGGLVNGFCRSTGSCNLSVFMAQKVQAAAWTSSILTADSAKLTSLLFSTTAVLPVVPSSTDCKW